MQYSTDVTYQKRVYLVPVLLLALLLNSCISSAPAEIESASPTVLKQRPSPPITERVLVPTPRPAATDPQSVDLQTEELQTNTIVASTDGLLTPEQAALLASLPSRGPAPELQNEVWFNSEPLTLADLRGQVVIVEFWTYG